MNTSFTELKKGEAYPNDLLQRLNNGEVFVARGWLQKFDLLKEIQSTSLEAIRQVAGENIANDINREGFEHIHRFASLEQIAEISNKIYDLVLPKTKDWVSRFVPTLINSNKSYYFEKSPNIRFITPYDFMVKNFKQLEEFARQHGGGKMTPHPPHKDSWVHCPDNLINVWVAIGPIPRGNGLTIFQDGFGKDYQVMTNGSLGYQENPGVPTLFDLEEGDAILFHGEHLHSTVLNHIETTRHVISFRIVDGKPHYPNGHFHHYLHSSLAGGPLNAFAEVPANLAPGWLTTRLRWVAEKLKLKPTPSMPKDWKRYPIKGDGQSSFKLSSLPVGSIKAVNDKLCIARTEEDKVVAFSRRCPHDGADFALGSVNDEGKVVCPWHALPFNLDTGKSPCAALKALRLYPAKIEEDTVSILLEAEQA